MPIDQPIPGQRWVSDTEPELGLGIILQQEFGRVEVLFPAANEHRQYALKSAPLRRVRFNEGDRIKTHEGAEFAVDRVEERQGLLIYRAAGREIAGGGALRYDQLLQAGGAALCRADRRAGHLRPARRSRCIAAAGISNRRCAGLPAGAWI